MNSIRQLVIGALGVIGTLALAAEQPAHAPHWAYQGKTSPEHWAELDDANKSCKLSREQSPIDIDVSKVKKAKLEPIDFRYAAGSGEVINNGHTVQVNLAPGSAIKIGAVEAPLLQFHFHTPSEEKFNGKNYPLVAHFVHKTADGKLYVVAVLFKEGKENAALKPVFASLPAQEGGKAALASLAPADVLPANHGYYHFMGSLTTPPCSDGVQWQVLKEPVELSHGQLLAFRKLYKMNARPVQPLNDRVVEVSD